jgi:chromate transport protein ChrA
LKGVASVGLILSTVVSLSKKVLSQNFDFLFITAMVITVNRLHLGLAILFHHPPKRKKRECESMNEIPALIRVFAYLSILTVGGGMAAFPEMKILTVDVHEWLTFPQLIHLYSVGHLAAGPNMMRIVSIGQWGGEILGAIVILGAISGRLLCSHSSLPSVEKA